MTTELKTLWQQERPAVVKKVSEAAAQGDRSENADYIYGKRRLREIDRRIQYLSKRLDALTVVERSPPDKDSVYFGAWVQIEDSDGNRRQYRLVGPDEFDMHEDYISIDSPMARALLKRRPGDVFTLRTGAVEDDYTVLSVSYDPA